MNNHGPFLLRYILAGILAAPVILAILAFAMAMVD